MAFEKTVKEQGIVISKIYNEAKPARQDFNGNKYEAKEEEFWVDVISCDEDDFDKVAGFPKTATRCRYKVEKAIYDKVKFGDWAKVKLTFVQYDKSKEPQPKPISFELLAKNN